jgi:pimeloyl-ACP methyl ester carboxylesterase
MALSTFADGRLWGARYGDGRPWVVALHGWGRDHSDFDAVLTGLDGVALDLPGFGVAPEPPAPWSTEEYARFVGPLLDEMSDGPIVVIGHSFGARVAVHLAARDREEHARAARVGVLVLTGAPLAPLPGKAPSRPALAYRVGRLLHQAGALSDRRMEDLRRRHGSEDYRRASQTMRGVLVKAVGETSGAAYMPLLRTWASAGGAVELVWGELDRVASLAGVQAGLAELPGAPAPATVVPGAGHLITAASAEQLRAAALRHGPATRARDGQ